MNREIKIETNKKVKKYGIECLIETALGNEFEALHFGVAAASLRARTTVIGGLNPDYRSMASWLI